MEYRNGSQGEGQCGYLALQYVEHSERDNELNQIPGSVYAFEPACICLTKEGQGGWGSMGAALQALW